MLPVVAENLRHAYGEGPLRSEILHGISFTVNPGEITLLVGPSGSGKSTLLTLVGALRSVQEGSLRVLGSEVRRSSERMRVEIRRRIGFIFQSHNLVASLTSLQNVALVLQLSEPDPERRRHRATALLEAVGLGHRLHHFPSELSGGQRQRVAIARALAPEPDLVLADEPTASLDSTSGQEVVALLGDLCRKRGSSVLLVTHDLRLLDDADRIWAIEDGRVEPWKGSH
ncbi:MULTISPECIES: ABC transporter ATP-binding protein [Cyanophyceae]|jgi:putative ABC transport system ATP-binding protein|uniref:ABC transporter n=1 Tax=Aphanothece cf. minutissima CCALA 015 TaxID=2107695 RepID=A0ABX5FB25_9CHRO|nr:MULTISPECIES: ATP-binding cassette domain-containing protein [Cyanophyceae]KAF0653138.1 antimicrobial peptide ABC transporter ATPase [Cyanobium sp. Copco_Reservoir_LC18]PSB39103.1 ABC transporter [Aphanothece cf. minutissima CCALA 015]